MLRVGLLYRLIPGNRRSFFLAFRTTPGRPDSAPTLHRGSRSQTVVASRARSSSRPLKASAWLPPRVTRLEGETDDLLTACRKAGRCKGDAARGYSATSHSGRTANGTPPPRSGERRRNVEHSEAYELFWSGKANNASMVKPIGVWCLRMSHRGCRKHTCHTIFDSNPGLSASCRTTAV